MFLGFGGLGRPLIFVMAEDFVFGRYADQS